MPSNQAPILCRTVDEIRESVRKWRCEGDEVALVPTMGALHAGHLSLISTARKSAKKIVVSIFINPTQFGKGEDFETYPRMWEQDFAALTSQTVDAVFVPCTEAIYPEDYATTITPKGPALSLETDYRPHFFSGVATIVTKLLLACEPDYAVFGEKDFQQLLVIRQVVRDLHIPCVIKSAPTLREMDGLAMSSRNAYLSQYERSIAPKLYLTMLSCVRSIRVGNDINASCEDAISTLRETGFEVDYFTIREAETLALPGKATYVPCRLLAAACLGKTRLIDNIAV